MCKKNRRPRMSRVLTLCIMYFIVFAVTIGAACDADDAQPADQLPIGLYLAYVPGDAFFPVRLDPETANFYTGLDVLETEKSSIEFDYDLSDVRYSGAPPQHRGFARLRLTGLTESAREILVELAFYTSAEGRHIEGRETIETDLSKVSHRLLIVNRDFQFGQHKFYLRYNEHWMLSRKEALTKLPDNHRPIFEHLSRLQLSHVLPGRYRPHIFAPEAVVQDWRDAPEVPPLRVEFPDTSEFKRPGAIPLLIPLEVPFSEVALVAFPVGTPKEIFQCRMNSTFYVATTKGVSRYRWILEHEYLDKVLREEVVYTPEAEETHEAGDSSTESPLKKAKHGGHGLRSFAAATPHVVRRQQRDAE
jgi:hypothetical protein